MLAGWARNESLSLRDGQAKLVKKGSMLIFQMHYTTNGQQARTALALVFTSQKGLVEKRSSPPARLREPCIPAGRATLRVQVVFHL